MGKDEGVLGEMRVLPRVLAILFLAGQACGGQFDKGASVRFGEYRQRLLTRKVFTLRLDESSVEVWKTSRTQSETSSAHFSGTWRVHGEWLIIRVGDADAPPSYYLARILKTGIELWQNRLNALPTPLAFPALPEWVTQEQNPERRRVMRAAHVSFLELHE